MRYRTTLLSILCCAASYASAQHVSLYISDPHVSIGINMPAYPEFVRVPNYPVYYAPRVNSNVFFYDGLYWVFTEDRWYASTWYNGPWGEVAPEAVPVYVLRVPVRYYRHPPAYFAGWVADAPPRWDAHWGTSWAQARVGWNSWNRSSTPAPAPLPVYQRQYSGTRYPTSIDQQVVIQSQQYRYQPRDTVVQQYYTKQGVKSAKESAPGQVKKQEGAKSAKAYAPGQVKKQEVAQVPEEVEATDRSQGHGQGQGQGQGHGKGKGHGKD